MIERKDLRRERSKTYQLDQRTFQLEAHCKPIHYQNGGGWDEIDLSFAQDNANFLALHNKVTCGFRRDGKPHKMFGLRYDYEHQFEITPVSVLFDDKEQIKAKTKAQPTAGGMSVDAGVRIVHRLSELALQSLVEVKKPIRSFKMVEEIHLKGLRCANHRVKDEYQAENGRFSFVNEKGETAFWINSPWYEDAKGERHHGLQHRLVQEGSQLLYVKEGDIPEAEYPILIDSSTYYAESSDGRIYRSDATWEQARDSQYDGIGETGTDTTSASLENAAAVWDDYDTDKFLILRSYFAFDTSPLPITAIVTAVDLMVYGYTNAEGDVCAQKSVHPDSINSGDPTWYSYCNCMYGKVTWAAGAYNTIAFNAIGLADINPDGYTKVVLREYDHDYLDVEATAQVKNGCYYSEEAGTDKDPKIVVTYSLDAAFGHPQSSKLYMAIKQPRTIWTAQAVLPFDPSSIDELDYDNGADEAGMDIDDFGTDLSVWFGSAAGLKDYGVARFRGFVEDPWIVRGTMKLAADMSTIVPRSAYISLVDDYRLWPRPPITEADGADLVIRKDIDLDASTEFHERPVPILGPPVCATLDAGEVDVEFDGTLSYMLLASINDPDSVANNGITAWAWWFEGGEALSTGTDESAASTDTVTYDTAGQYIVRLTVTAAKNGGGGNVTATGYRTVFIFDEENPPYTDFKITSLRGSVAEHGWVAEVALYGDLLDEDILDNGAQVVIFGEDLYWVYGHGHTPFFPDRENIKLVGWLSDSQLSVKEGKIESATATIAGLGEYLRHFSNYSCYLTWADVNAPEWSYLSQLTFRRALYHLIRWHWTLFTFTDVYLWKSDYLPSVDAYIMGQDFPDGTLIDQLDSICSDRQSGWSTGRGGQLRVYPVPNLIQEAIRGDDDGWGTKLNIDDSSFGLVDMVVNVSNRASAVRVEGLSVDIAGAYTTHIVTEPSTPFGFEGNVQTLGSQILDNATHATALAKLQYAWGSRLIDRMVIDLGIHAAWLDVDEPSRISLSYDPTGGFRGQAWEHVFFWVTELEETLIEEHVIRSRATIVPETRTGPLAYVDPNTPYHTYCWWPPPPTLSRELERAVAKTTSGQGTILGLSSGETAPSETTERRPALMGTPLPSETVTGPSQGTSYVRLYGNTLMTTIAINPGFKETYDRPIWVEKLDRAANKNLRPGESSANYIIVDTRPNETEYDTSNTGGLTTAEKALEAWAQGAKYSFYDMVLFQADTTLSVAQAANNVMRVPQGVYLRDAWVHLNVAPTGANLIVDIHTRPTVGGAWASIFADAGDRPVVLAGAYTGIGGPYYPPILLTGDDMIVFFIDQVGSATPGGNITVQLRCLQMGI